MDALRAGARETLPFLSLPAARHFRTTDKNEHRQQEQDDDHGAIIHLIYWETHRTHFCLLLPGCSSEIGHSPDKYRGDT